MTLHQKLIRAAMGLPPVFRPADLTVAVHRLFPGAFSLRGYPAYPDHNRIMVFLCRRSDRAQHKSHKGLAHRGPFTRPQPGWLALDRTNAEVQAVIELANQRAG
jgi:hypothetical protein